MLKGIRNYQQEHRPWSIVLHDEARTGIDLGWVGSKKWDGVISRNSPPALVQLCAKLNVPLVDLNDTPPFPGVSKIRPDNRAIGRIGAVHFMERKFRHFGFCGFANHSWSRDRRDGYVEAVGRMGHGCEVFEVEHPGDFTSAWEDSQSALLVAWLRGLPKETAVMACDDFRARQVIQAAQIAGLHVPGEVAVLGANNDTMVCELTEPTISSVAINAYESGRRAAEQLERLIEVGKTGVIDLRIDPIGVVARKSTDVLARRDKNVAIAFSFIERHACKGITVQQVLQQVSISRSQLEHKFRRFIGHSPQVEIRSAQIAKIRQLLLETNLSLKQIAQQTGFVHVEYMCVMFKRLTGDTPGRYRRKNFQTHEHFWTRAGATVPGS